MRFGSTPLVRGVARAQGEDKALAIAEKGGLRSFLLQFPEPEKGGWDICMRCSCKPIYMGA